MRSKAAWDKTDDAIASGCHVMAGSQDYSWDVAEQELSSMGFDAAAAHAIVNALIHKHYAQCDHCATTGGRS